MTWEAFRSNSSVSRWGMIADGPSLTGLGAEAAGTVEEGYVCSVEAAVEGRCRCSWASARRVVERSGRSSAEGSQVRTEVEGNRARLVAERSQETLAEAVGRSLFSEHQAINVGFAADVLFLPSGGAGQRVSQRGQDKLQLLGETDEDRIRLANWHFGHSWVVGTT